MNLKLIIPFIGMMTLASCSEEEQLPNPENHIRFSAFVGDIEQQEVRSTLVQDALLRGTSFGVIGYCIPYINGTTTLDYPGATSLWSNKKHNCYPDVFYKQEVKINATGESCDYTPVKEWCTTPAGEATDEANFTYSFFAYYPYSQWEILSTSSDLDAPKLKFTMPFDATSTELTDFSSVPPLDDSIVEDVMLAVKYNHKRANGDVAFNFSHVMTGLDINIHNHNEIDATDASKGSVTVKSVKLQGNFTRSISIDYSVTTGNNYTYGSDFYAGVYSFYDNEEGITVSAGQELDASSFTDLLLLSNFTNTDYQLGTHITLVVQYLCNGAEKTFSASLPDAFAPKPGVIYTFTLGFVGDTFVLTVNSDTQWEDGGDSDSTIS